MRLINAHDLIERFKAISFWSEYDREIAIFEANALAEPTMLVEKGEKMRLIDADALMKEFRDFVRNSNNSDFAPVPNWNDAVSLVGSAPTVDAVQVVRCKNCFYAIPYNEKWTLPKKNNCLWCKRYEDIRTHEWFCADGERREDE